MSQADQIYRKFPGISVGLGSLISILLFSPFNPFETTLIEQILLLAMLVLVPAFLPFLGEPTNRGTYPVLYRFLILFQPVASFSALLSYLPVPAHLSGLFATVWLLFCLLVSVHGIYRYLRNGNDRIEELSLDFASFYITIGGIWFVASRFSLQFLGFLEPFVVLTAIHFHYTAFSTLVLIGLVGRNCPDDTLERYEGWYKVIVWGVILATPAIAIGITYSPLLELVSTLALTIVLLTYAAGMIYLLQKREFPIPQRYLLLLSSLSLLVSMPMASIYAVGVYAGTNYLTISQMVLLHGLPNSLGFILLGLVAVHLLPSASRISRTSIPFSQITIDGKMTDSYFEDHGLVDHEREVTGMVDDLDSYNSSVFDDSVIHPTIRDFYEQTAFYDLEIEADWKFGFGWLSRIYRFLSQRLGQMNFPQQGVKDQRQLANKLLPIGDNRGDVRTWVRSYQDSGETLYAAIYYQYDHDSMPFMNIAFPMPGKQMTSVMRMQGLKVEHSDLHALELTTLPQGVRPSHEGIYLVFRKHAIRLPFNETIRVWSPSQVSEEQSNPRTPQDEAPDDSPDLVAEHKIWLFGYNFLTLNYKMNRVPQ